MSNQEHISEFVNEINDAIRALTIFYPKENLIPPIEKIIFNPPATIVFWDDGEKTVVKCKESEEFDCECGLAFAIAKRYFGSRSGFKKAIGRAKKITSDPDKRKNATDSTTFGAMWCSGEMKNSRKKPILDRFRLNF